MVPFIQRDDRPVPTCDAGRHVRRMPTASASRATTPWRTNLPGYNLQFLKTPDAGRGRSDRPGPYMTDKSGSLPIIHAPIDLKWVFRP